jgi:hypothetical protein
MPALDETLGERELHRHVAAPLPKDEQKPARR